MGAENNKEPTAKPFKTLLAQMLIPISRTEQDFSTMARGSVWQFLERLSALMLQELPCKLSQENSESLEYDVGSDVSYSS